MFCTMEDRLADRTWHKGYAIGKKDYDLPVTGGYQTKTFYVIETDYGFEYPIAKVERMAEHIRFL